MDRITLEKYKGLYVRLDYTTKIGSKDSRTGQIIELNNNSIVFDVNDNEGVKIRLVYERITNIFKLTKK